MSARSLAVFMAVLAVIGLLGFGLLKKSDAALDVGEPIPERALPSLDGSGDATVADYRGGWVLLNVWASWCTPCRDESPTLERFYRAHRSQDFTIVGIDTNDLSDDALGFLRRYGITYPQLHDGDGDFAQDDLGTTGVPESFLVDPRGKLVLHRAGPVTAEYLDSNVTPFLTGKAKG